MLTRHKAFLAAALAFEALLIRVPSSTAQENTRKLPKVVSSMQGMTLTEEEISRAAAADLQKFEIQKLQFDANYERNRYQAVENAVARLVEEKLLAAEAARQGITSAQLLAREVEKNVRDATDQEASAFYESNKAHITAPRDQVMPQIKQYLKQQSSGKMRSEYIERLKKADGVSYTIEPLRTRLETAGYPSLGPADAAVTIIEFSDFQCTYCKAAHSTIEKVLRDFSSDVRLVYRQFPLSEIHPLAERAAEASLCAQEQNKFWQMHDLMFAEQGNLGVADLKAKAARLGLDAAAFDACLDSNRHAGRIRQDLRDGAQAGVTGTPTLFINGRFLSGSHPYDNIANIIKDELQRKKSKP